MEFDYKQAKRFLNDKALKQVKCDNELLHKALKDFDAILELIIMKYHPLRVYQWGSLIEQKHFSEISDIDIAVEGINSPQDFFALYKEIEDMTSFSVDLIQIEKIEPEFREIIQIKGKVVYERK